MDFGAAEHGPDLGCFGADADLAFSGGNTGLAFSEGEVGSGFSVKDGRFKCCVGDSGPDLRRRGATGFGRLRLSFNFVSGEGGVIVLGISWTGVARAAA